MVKLKKLVKTFLSISLLLIVSGFSDIKQSDEYSCGPVCAANCVINILNQNLEPQKLVAVFTELAKTDKNGTTSQNLCTAIETFFGKTKLKTNIKYYGIRQVDRKYRMSHPLNICEEIERGSSVVLNLGFYKQQGKFFQRTEGHYVNAYACKDNQILIADPYSRDKAPFYVTLEKYDTRKGFKIKNNKDNEKYGKRKYTYYKVSPKFDYLTNDETAFLNGIISIYPLYL